MSNFLRIGNGKYEIGNDGIQGKALYMESKAALGRYLLDEVCNPVRHVWKLKEQVANLLLLKK